MSLPFAREERCTPTIHFIPPPHQGCGTKEVVRRTVQCAWWWWCCCLWRRWATQTARGQCATSDEDAARGPTHLGGGKWMTWNEVTDGDEDESRKECTYAYVRYVLLCFQAGFFWRWAHRVNRESRRPICPSWAAPAQGQKGRYWNWEWNTKLYSILSFSTGPSALVSRDRAAQEGQMGRCDSLFTLLGEHKPIPGVWVARLLLKTILSMQVRNRPRWKEFGIPDSGTASVVSFFRQHVDQKKQLNKVN